MNNNDKNKRLMKAADEEKLVVESLLAAGGIVKEAARTKGTKQTNRHSGDVWFVTRGDDKIHSIELQVSPGPYTNYTLSLSKRHGFVGHNGDGRYCYHMFGNDATGEFMIVPKEFVDESIDEVDSDIIIKSFDQFVVVSPSGLSASGEVLGFGRSIEECIGNFVQNI